MLIGLESGVSHALSKAGHLLFDFLLHKILEWYLAFRHLKAKSLLITERLVHFIRSILVTLFLLYLIPTETRWLFSYVFSCSNNKLQMISVSITAIEWFATTIFRNWKKTKLSSTLPPFHYRIASYLHVWQNGVWWRLLGKNNDA